MKKQNSILYYFPILAIGLLYYALIIWVIPRESFYSPDSGVKFIQLEEMIKQESWNPTIDYPGAKVDQGLEFQPFSWLVEIKGNKIYSHYSPFYPWLSSFFYKELGVVGLYIISATAGFLSLLVMYHLARYYFNNFLSLISTVILGLGTPIFFYSLEYWEHALAFFFAITTLLLTIKIINGEKRYLVLLPFLSLLSFYTRSETIVFVFSIFLAGAVLLWKDMSKYRRNMLGACVVLLTLTGAFISFNLITSGTIFGIHVSKHLFSYSVLSNSIFDPIRRLIIITTLLGRSGIAFHSILEYCTTAITMLAFLMVASSTILMKIKGPIHKGKAFTEMLILGISIISIVAIINLIKRFSIIGMFQVTPFVIFSLFCFLEQDQDIFKKFIKLSGLIYFICILFIPNVGGVQWGPRYILPFYPILIICFWNALPVMKRYFSKRPLMYLNGSFFILLLFSFILQVNGVMKLYYSKSADLQGRNTIENESTGVVISNYEHFLASNCPDLYDKKMFFNVNKKNISILINKLFEHGITTFSISSSKSIFNDLQVKYSDILGTKLPNKNKVHFVRNIYSDQENSKVLLKIFEIQ